MKKLLLFLLVCSFSAAVFAQSVPKYVMLEHFTNSRCGICASRNPAFFTLIEQHPNDVHHIAYHPSFPYNTCVFYLANTAENNARANFYDIDGTPRVVLNGLLVPLATSLLPTATLNTALAQTSPIYVQVSETTDVVTVRVYTVGEVTPGDTYKIYVALAEKTINQATPNGENVHHNVFRDMVADAEITLAPQGEFVELSYTKTTNASWNANEIYALAWVQNVTTDEILNSGTKFDPVLSGVSNPVVKGELKVSPNPSTDQVTMSIPVGESVESFHLVGLDGRIIYAAYQADQQVLTVATSNLEAGMYVAVVTTKNATYTGKLSKL
jgi:Secretion system C-terminal sorting domain